MNANELESLILKRRSIRKFQSTKVEEDKIHRIIQAGIWAPTGTNQQELRFYILNNEKYLEEFYLFKKIKSPGVILIFIDYGNYYRDYGQKIKHQPHKKSLPYIDTGLAMMNMMLMAESLGLRSIALNVSPHLFYIRNKTTFFLTKILNRINIMLKRTNMNIRFWNDFCQKDLGIDTMIYHPAGAIGLGYSDQQPDINTLKHGKKPVKRGNLEQYLLQGDK